MSSIPKKSEEINQVQAKNNKSKVFHNRINILPLQMFTIFLFSISVNLSEITSVNYMTFYCKYKL